MAAFYIVEILKSIYRFYLKYDFIQVDRLTELAVNPKKLIRYSIIQSIILL